MTSGWVLAVDFGTSNTAAAHHNETTGAIQALQLSHSSYLMSSGGYVTTPEQIDVGDIAADRAASNPQRYVPTPKRLLSLGNTTIDAAGERLPAYLFVAAVLRAVLIRAQQQHDGRPPSKLVLTHPADWAPHQIRILTEAAAEIGFGGRHVSTVSEPRAAVRYYCDGAAVPAGRLVAVFDFGGGTLDVAVLGSTTRGEPLGVVAAGGNDQLGGLNLDRAIRTWVDRQLADVDPLILGSLQADADDHDIRALELSIRAAKELLSEAPAATITVTAGGRRCTLRLTRTEFESLIEPEVAQAIELTTSVFREAGVSEPDELHALYLVGGSSRIPLVQHRLREIAPVATLDDPKTVVAQGALMDSGRNVSAAARTPHPAGPISPTGQRIRPILRIVAAGILVVAMLAVGVTFVTSGTADRGLPTGVAGPGNAARAPTVHAGPPPATRTSTPQHRLPVAVVPPSTQGRSLTIPQSFDGTWKGPWAMPDNDIGPRGNQATFTVTLRDGESGGTWQNNVGMFFPGCGDGALFLMGAHGRVLEFGVLFRPGVCVLTMALKGVPTVSLEQQDGAVLAYRLTYLGKTSIGQLAKQ